MSLILAELYWPNFASIGRVYLLPCTGRVDLCISRIYQSRQSLWLVWCELLFSYKYCITISQLIIVDVNYKIKWLYIFLSSSYNAVPEEANGNESITRSWVLKCLCPLQFEEQSCFDVCELDSILEEYFRITLSDIRDNNECIKTFLNGV